MPMLENAQLGNRENGGARWFDDLPVIGRQSEQESLLKLREMGEDDSAGGAPLDVDEFGLIGFSRPPRAWQHTAHAFGFLRPGGTDREEFIPITHAGNIGADTGLRGKRIKITLDQLRVVDYPGGGTHCVLFDFYAQNQVPKQVEHLHFNARFRARQGERAAVVGFPVFVGLNVGDEGVAFRCLTVNVKNEEDEAFLGFLESDVFRAGLKLATTAQPALGPLSEAAVNLTKFVARRHRNVPVQEFCLGLDFSKVATRARLAIGSYIAVQIPETLNAIWDWSEWIYLPHTGQIVNQHNRRELIPYNYLVFSVSPFQGA